METRNPYTEKGRVPLRLDRNTVVLVRPEKATKEYAEELRKKYAQSRNCPIPSRYLGDYY